MTRDDRHLTEYAAQVEELLAEIESFPDPAVRDRVAGIVQGMLALYGEGLARIVEQIGRGVDRSPSGMLEALAGDELVAHLLLLHDLHPLDLETRVNRALEAVRPNLQSHGTGAELVSLQEGTAQVRLHGKRPQCPSSAASLRRVVEAAVLKSAPDLLGIVIEDAGPPPAGPGGTFIPLAALGAPTPPDEEIPVTSMVGGTEGAPHG